MDMEAGPLSSQRALSRPLPKSAGRAISSSDPGLASLVEGIPQLVWRASAAGEWTWCGRQWTTFTGLRAEQSLGLGWLDALHPDDREATQLAWQQALANRATLAVHNRLFGARKGDYRWFQTRATPVLDDDGTIVEWLGTSTDIDDLVRLRDQQRILIAELQHRTRNLLGVVRSIGRQLISTSVSMEDFQARFEDRLSAMSRVQGLLSRADAREVTFRELVDMELGAVSAARDERVMADGPPVRLPDHAVQILALALHELATNALKYGALRYREGELRISWWSEKNAQRKLHVDWSEHRPRAGVPAFGMGYGRDLIENALPYQLGATTDFSLGPDGMRCSIVFPLV
jgi:PAS domain S-box-containing protein